MPNKKSALSRTAAKTAPKPVKKAPATRREPAAASKKAAAKPVKAAKAPAEVKPAKAAPKEAAQAARKGEAKPVRGGAKAAPKTSPPKPKAPAKVAKAPPEPKKAPPKPKAATKPTPAAKGDKPSASAEKAAAAKPAKPEKPPRPAKPPKPPKPPKPVKLAPVEAALAKPIPAKPLAVAAGRAQPIARSPLTPPARTPQKPLVAPKPAAAEPEVVGEMKAVPAFKGKAAGAKGQVLVGAVAGAFGVKGEVRLRAFTDKKEGVISYGPLYGEDGKVLLRPKSWRELKDGVAVIAPEVKTREDAEKLRGRKLYVPRANLPAPAEDEFYIVDLLGSRAEALDGTILGDIVAVWNFGAGDILEYRPPSGGPNVRVTFTKETVPHVDLAARRVVLDPPAPEPVGK